MATLKETVNDMVYKLRLFSSEVTRVSLDVGTMGQLGGQAVVTGVEGTWKTRQFSPQRLYQKRNTIADPSSIISQSPKLFAHPLLPLFSHVTDVCATRSIKWPPI